MNEKDILQEVEKLCREVCDNSSIVLNETTSANDVDEWDSFAHVSLIMSIEKHYGIRFALGELQNLKNVGELVHVIGLKLNEAK